MYWRQRRCLNGSKKTAQLNTSGDEFNVSGSLNCQKDGWLGRQILPELPLSLPKHIK
jgi:hypothetical protein